jgi:hypothetical protein
MNTIVRTTAVLLFALAPLSPAAFASDRHHGGDRHHETRHGHHYHHGWHRHHGHYRGHYGVRYGYHPGYRVVLPAPPLPPVILPPHVVLHKAR